MLDKVGFIESYIFDEKVSKKEQMERFNIAWDIRYNFESIMLNMRKKLFKTVRDIIKSSKKFEGYYIKDLGFLEGEKYQPLCIYKKNWIFNGDALLSYSIEAESNGFINVFFGIRKQDGDKGVPFKGSYPDNKKLKEFVDKIRDQFRGKFSDWWIVYKNFDSYYTKTWEQKLYMEIIEKGYQGVAEYYFNKLLQLKESTEHLIDEFVKLYDNAVKQG